MPDGKDRKNIIWRKFPPFRRPLNADFHVCNPKNHRRLNISEKIIMKNEFSLFSNLIK